MVLDVHILSSSEPLTSTWRLLPGHSNGTEEGEEFEESSLFFQVECINIYYSHQPSHPNCPEGRCILLAKPLSFPHDGINRDDSSVLLDVNILSSSEPLTSTWRLFPGDSNGAEDGEEFEESSLFSQVEFTNLHCTNK